MIDNNDKYKDLNLDSVYYSEKHILLNWSSESLGFGQIIISLDKGKIKVNSECMSDDFVKAVMKLWHSTGREHDRSSNEEFKREVNKYIRELEIL